MIHDTHSACLEEMDKHAGNPSCCACTGHSCDANGFYEQSLGSGTSEIPTIQTPEPSETEKGLTAMYDLGVKHGREQAFCDMRRALTDLWTPINNKDV